MITVRRSAERGHADHGWLDTRHTFSFASYHDPRHMGFRALRVINEDVVQPSAGFDTHPHRDMEIVTWVLAGSLAHRDSLGHGSTIRPGVAQRMTAGSGILHSEFNPSDSEAVHLLQIWILPAERGLPPSWEEREFAPEERRGRLRLIASPGGREGSLTIRQDVDLYAGLFGAGQGASLALRSGRHAWVQVARGALAVNGRLLRAGDGAALSEEPALSLAVGDDEPEAEVLVFDLA